MKAMVKKSVTVTIDSDLLDWVRKKCEEKEFGSLSHAIEKGLTLLKKQLGPNRS